MLGTGKSIFAKKYRAKRLKVCYRCVRWTCNATCRSLGMVSINREDKIQLIKDGLSKGSLDNLLLTLETHSLGNLTKKDPVCQFLKKLDGKLTRPKD